MGAALKKISKEKGCRTNSSAVALFLRKKITECTKIGHIFGKESYMRSLTRQKSRVCGG